MGSMVYVPPLHNLILDLGELFIPKSILLEFWCVVVLVLRLKLDSRDIHTPLTSIFHVHSLSWDMRLPAHPSK